MRCAWDSLLGIIPPNLRPLIDRYGKTELQEIRFRIGVSTELVLKNGSKWLEEIATSDDINFVVNAASRYSPWAAATIRKGYITACGGHRVGLCGEAVIQNNEMTGIRNPTSLCIRVARDFPGIAANADTLKGSLLIIGKPGSGKTTLLRDLIRQKAESEHASIAVIDERGEIFPVFDQKLCFPTGSRTDIMTGCSKLHGIEAVLRTMSPTCIAVDEITAEEDCKALINAGWSGVSLLATAHAESISDLNNRPVYRPLINCGIFRSVLVMQPDKTWTEERI